MARTRIPYVPAAVRRARIQSACGWIMIVATVIGLVAMGVATVATTVTVIGACAAITGFSILAIIIAYDVAGRA